MIFNIPGTDTPGITETDRNTMTWAAKFAGTTGRGVYELLSDAGLDGAEVRERWADGGYPELCGVARYEMGALLHIIERLTAQQAADRQTIAELRETLRAAQ